ncbi:hypothetical protein ABID86_006654 [Methylobacterium radiotolerans]|uniref:Uncharacterized protein n=1 Tax=Methylobacterium radiotolerans TaxID=31998 RepID=A0ABV2NTN8_9HYPH|nr:hypothetical protein [Methylobacterium sp. PvP109]
MGRVKESDIGRSLSKRLDAKVETLPVEASASVQSPARAAPAEPQAVPRKPRARDGMHYVGCHVPEDLWERLRVVAFETRKEKQVLMREGLEVILKKYGG